eukprot:709231-Amphidinium_carterae.1
MVYLVPWPPQMLVLMWSELYAICFGLLGEFTGWANVWRTLGFKALTAIIGELCWFLASVLKALGNVLHTWLQKRQPQHSSSPLVDYHDESTACVD